MTTKKGKSRETRPPGIVKTLAELAAAASVSSRTIATWKCEPGFPVEPDGTFNIWKVAQWHSVKKPQREMPGEDDPEDKSEALELWRYERFLMAKMDREEREQMLVSRERIHAFVMTVSGLLRGWLDRLQRKHGAEVYESAVNILEDIERETDREFGDDDTIEGDAESV